VNGRYIFQKVSHVTHGRGITKHHFALYVGHLIDTLQDHGINEQDEQKIIDRISNYADEITGDVGSAG
jgi:hemoglobin